MARSLCIVDGHSQIYRAYYAPFAPLTSPSGRPTRAVHVFCTMLLSLLRNRRPDYLVVALDADETRLLRREIYPEYKAHREPPPEDLGPQEEQIIAILAAAGVPLLRQPGYEADDVIATLVHRFRPGAPGGAECDETPEIVIISRDKDLDQLLRPGVCLYDPLKDETVTAEGLAALKGWRPDQAIDAQVLIGDSVDNVPGVRGIGPKTAARLLQQYGSLAGILAHAEELKPKLRESLRAFEPHLERTRRLVTLHTDVPLEFQLAEAECVRLRWDRARPTLRALGLRRVLEQLPAARGAAGDSEEPRAEAGGPAGADEGGRRTVPTEVVAGARGDPEGGVGAADRGGRGEALVVEPAARSLREPDGGDYRLVNTPEAFEALLAELRRQPEFALDTETTSVSPVDCDLVGIALAWEVGRGYFIPVRSAYGPVLPLDLVQRGLGPLLRDPTRRKIGQNLKYDLIVLRQAGLPVEGPLFDTMIAAFVLDPAGSSHGLDHLAERLLGHRMIPITDLIGRGRDPLRMDQVPLGQIAEYAGEDADYTWRLSRLLEPRLEPAGVARLFADVEMPLVRVLADMETAGIAIDVPYLERMGVELTARAEALAAQVHALVGRVFNLDSPKQLAEVLFDGLKFRVVRRTKTTRSTDAETLEALAAETGHPIFPLLLEYRELQKLRGTYVDALPRQRARRTGRIHTSYHQTGTVTGRLSSSEPNLQNIPVRTELGRRIRRAFVPGRPDEVLLVADYSQVELRVLAHFCGDEALRQAFAADQDIHAFVAAQVAGVPLEAVTREMRSRAKAVNFGIIYGQTAFGLAQATGLSRTEAQTFIDAYFRRYPRIRAFIEQCLADAKRDGGVRTILGRWRPIENITSRNASVRAQAERFAVNTVIQGSAADLIKLAMISLHRRIAAERLPLRMLLQVHDELVCETPRDAAPAMAEVVRSVMSGALELAVPLRVDVAWGSNWLEAK